MYSQRMERPVIEVDQWKQVVESISRQNSAVISRGLEKEWKESEKIDICGIPRMAKLASEASGGVEVVYSKE